MSFLPPKELLSTASCNHLLLALITTDLVVRSLLYSGGNEMQSMKNVYRQYAKRAIHSMSPMRLLSLCTGTKCEWCNENSASHDKFVEAGISTCRTTRVRPHFPSRVCWACLQHSRIRRSISSPNRAIYSRLTKPVYKVRGEELNQYYVDNRQLLFEIWSHERVLAYPYGLRYLDDHEGSLIPVGDMYEAQNPVDSKDAFELMWSEPTLDSYGNPTGPIMTASLLQDLVSYLNKIDDLSLGRREWKEQVSRGIDYFLDHLVTYTSSPTSYIPIIRAYENCIEDAEHVVQERKLNAIAQENIKRFNKIDLAMKGIDALIKETSKGNIMKWLEEISRVNRPATYFTTQCEVMTRVLLLYREIPYKKGTWVLTYDTGCPTLNRALHKVLGDFLKNPRALSSSEARQLAKTVYKRSRDILTMDLVEGVYSDRSNTIIRQGFSARYRREYRPSPIALSKFPEWKDTSANRRP